MNGAESLIRTALAAGVEVCFANPGTSEMPLVAALDQVDGMRSVLGLFEGVLSGAADGYGRMAEKPALTLFHLGPGHGNAIANFHNARRARTPIVNLIGDQATWHRRFDAPLSTDIESLARPVSGWFRSAISARTLSWDGAAAIAAASRKPGCIASLAVPTDCQWDPAPRSAPPQPIGAPDEVSPEAVEEAARLLRSGKAMLLVGGHGTRRPGLRHVGRIGRKAGCRLGVETFAARLERGPSLPELERLPYFPEQADGYFAGLEHVVLAGADDPVAFFGYPSGISRLVPESVNVFPLARPTDDVEAALSDLAAALDAREDCESREVQRPSAGDDALTPDVVGRAIAAVQPEDAIVVDEGITSAGGYGPASVACPDHTYLNLTGGAIGWGLPCATGCAIACPDRKVIALEGDGSGLYTVQALWTQAREGLDVVNIVFANDVYRILQIELHRAGVDEPGPQSLGLTDLRRPEVQWSALSESFGVPATRVETGAQLAAALQRALQAEGPHTIEARVP